MAELTKKQKKVLEELKAGTYKTPSEQRRERRDANLRKQQAQAQTKTEDIAPFKPTQKDSWFSSGALGEGLSIGNIAKTIIGTGMDVKQDFIAGGMKIGEGVIDAGAHAIGYVAKGLKQDDFADKMKGFIKKDLIDEERIATQVAGANPSGIIANKILGLNPFKVDDESMQTIEDTSVMGAKADGLTQSAGQLAGTVALQRVGVPWQVTTGATSFGTASEQAFKNDATWNEATFSATVSTGAELLTESLFKIPGISATGSGKFGAKLVDKLSKNMSKTVTRNFMNFGINMFGEGAEEAITSFFQNLGEVLSYEREETLQELVENEEARDAYVKQVLEKQFGKEAWQGYKDDFIGGSVLSFGGGAPSLVSANKAGVNLNSGLTDAEEQTYKAEVEQALKDKEQAKGKKLTSKEKTEIEENIKQQIIGQRNAQEIAPVQDAKIKENAPSEIQDAPMQVSEEVDTEAQIAEKEALLEQKVEEYEQTEDPRLKEIIRDEVEAIQEEIYTEQERVDSLVGEEAPIGTELTTEERQELDMYEEFVEENGVEALDKDSKERYDYLKQHEELDTTPEEEITEKSKPKSPVAERDMKEIGSRKVKSHIEENPESRPYFQQEAENMLYDLDNTIKGEKMVTQVYNPVTGLYENAEWTGTTRQTTEAIAYLRDNYGYTYAQIRKGLEDLLANDGRKLNAVAKRIEVLLDERMTNGYTTSDGISIPANEDYIKFLEEKEFNKQSSENFNAITEEDTPIEKTIEAPSQIDENDRISEENTRVMKDVAPTPKEAKNSNTDVTEANEEKAPVNEEIDTSFMREETKKKLENYQKQRNQLQLDRRQSYKDFNSEIRNKTAEYEGLKNKNTKKANNLLQQLANLEMRRDNIQDEYSRRIANTTNKIDNMKTDDFVKKEKKASQDEIRRKLFNDTGIIKESLDFAKDLSKPMLHNTDPIRLQEMVFGRKLGGKINEMLFQKVKDNTSKKTRFQNLERDAIRELGIEARSKESSAVQKYGEKKYVDEDGKEHIYGDAELKAEFPNVEDQEKIKKASQVIRQKYDTYIDKANAVITKYGYDPIPKRKDYMRHFQELNDKFSQWGLPFNMQSAQANDLPTDLNGLTADLKPGKNWFASAMKRKGNKTTYDAITGIDGYIEGIGNLIYHTDDIQTLRGFENYIREIYGQEHGFENLDNLSETEKSIRMQSIQDNHLGNYVAWLREYTNTLAGKKAMVDRAVEDVIGRRAYSFLTELKSQVGSNMTGLNIGSALTNPISMTQALAKTSKLATLKGYADTIKNIFVKDDFVYQNDFLTSRFGSDILAPTAWQKMRNAGQVFMSATDWFASNAITRSKFYELKAQGLGDTEAHREAGKFASRILGDRSQGATPTLYNSKMLGLVTQFQLEVNNQLYSMFGDTIADAKETSAKEGALKASMRATFVLGQLAVYQHTFNNLYEGIAGRRPAFDIISMIGTILGVGLSEEEKEEKPLDDRIFEAVDMLIDALPYVNVLTGGGRIPVSEALPFKELLSGEDEYGNEKSRLETLGEAIPYYLLPTGYSQIKKTVGGASMYDEDLPVAGSYTDSGNLRFTADEDPMSKLQAGIFGQWANKNAQEYIKNDFESVDKDNIDELVELGMESPQYIEYRKGLNEIKKMELKDEESRLTYIYDYISKLDATEDQKGTMFKHYSSDKEQEAFEKLDMSPKDIVSYYGAKSKISQQTAEYLVDKDLLTSDTESEEYKEAVKTLSNEKKTAIIDAVKSADLTDKQKEYLYTKYYSSEKSLDKILERGTSMDTYLQFERDTLDFEADEDEDGKVISGSKGNKYEEYLLNSNMSDEDKQTLYEYGALSSFDDEDNYKKYKAFKSAGIDINSYLSYASQTFEADKNKYGKTISGSRKSKVIKYVNKLNLSIPQKAMIIRSEYSSYKDYNKSIIKYVNSLDLTITEKTKILEELDFKVKGNKISW